MYKGTNLIMGDGKNRFLSRCLENVSCGTHANFEAEVVVVTKGALCMEIGDEKIELHRGEIAFVAPFEPHSFRSERDNECRIIMFSWHIAEEFFEFLKAREVKKHSFKISSEVLRIVDRILPNPTDEPDIIPALAVVSLLCNEICEKCEFEEASRKYSDTLFESLDTIHNSYREEITLESIAREIGVHPVTLSRKFSKGTGLSINSYINWVRCCCVKDMIENGADNLAESALEAGFGSIRSFNRAFVRFFGITPSEYRRERNGRD